MSGIAYAFYDAVCQLPYKTITYIELKAEANKGKKLEAKVEQLEADLEKCREEKTKLIVELNEIRKKQKSQCINNCITMLLLFLCSI